MLSRGDGVDVPLLGRRLAKLWIQPRLRHGDC
jgi:hypothetical protein